MLNEYFLNSYKGINILNISCDIALRWISKDFTDDKSTSVQEMAWCRQTTSHCLSQCWPRSRLPYGVTRPQWVIWKESIRHRAPLGFSFHYSDVIMSAITSEITGASIVCSTVCLGADQTKHQSSALGNDFIIIAKILSNTGLSNGLSDDTRLLYEPILTNHQWPRASAGGNFTGKSHDIYP